MRKRERESETQEKEKHNVLIPFFLFALYYVMSCSSGLFSLSAVVFSAVSLSAVLLVLFPCFAVPYIHAYPRYSFEALES